MKTVNLKLIDNLPPSISEINFDPQEYYIVCSVKYNEIAKESTLSNYISTQFNIRKIEPSINLGYTSIQFDSEFRFASFEVYTNTERWIAATIKPVVISKGNILWNDSFECESGNGSYKEIYDANQSCFSLVWQNSTHWIHVADKLIIGLMQNEKPVSSDDFQLAEIRIFGIHHQCAQTP